MAKKNSLELGRGIRALLSNMDTAVAENPTEVVRQLSSSVAMISTESIEVNPYQPRKEFDAISLQELSESIKTHGLVQPITVRRLNNTTYQLISGERRLRACRLAQINEIPAYIRLADNDQAMLELALVENIQREELNAIEISITYQRLMDECNLTHEMLSNRVGKQRSTVTNYLRLLKLSPDIQQALKKAQISMGHARALLGIDDIALQLTVFHQIMRENLSVRQVEDLIRNYSENQKKSNSIKKPLTLSDDFRKVQDNLSNLFATKVALKRQTDGKGQIIINFSSESDLNRLLDIIEIH